MKTEIKILFAFILNLAFSIFEFAGGIITGSIAIISDATHDAGDAASIGLSYFFERKSKKHPDDKYTYGYARYSVIGGFISSLILFIGSALMIYNSIGRIITPTKVNYNGMIAFALVGVCVNFCAASFTRGSGSLNQKAVNLHMLEDVLGWVVVLAGAVVMRYTNFVLLDPILSICVSIYILVNATKNIKEITELFLEKVPHDIDVEKIKDGIQEIDGIVDVHHIHLWSLDGQNNYATMHIIADENLHEIKKNIREKLQKYGINHVTVETETSSEHCHEKQCHVEFISHTSHGHHHHQH